MVGSTGMERLEQLIGLIVEENEQQNLIAGSTVAHIWSRHVLDSLQLIRWARPGDDWLDIGTGGGFPGLAIGAVRAEPMILVEPRRRRADFLRRAAELIDLPHVRVEQGRVEDVTSCAAIISARAVAPIEKLLRASSHCATPSTRWVFPRGTVSENDIAEFDRWSGMMFHVEQSLTDPRSSIVVVERRAR